MSVRKIFTIASREFRAMVGTKAFLFSIALMPVLMLGGLILPLMLRNVGEIKERRIIVADPTGIYLPFLQQAAEARNKALDAAAAARAKQESGGETPPQDEDSERERYLLLVAETATLDDETRLKLSDDIRDGQLYAVLEIPAGLDDDPRTAGDVRFYSQDAAISEARQWIQYVLREKVREQQFVKRGLDPREVQAAQVEVPVLGKALYKRAASGAVESGLERDVLTTIFVPFGTMMFMFLVIFMAAQPMLESVLEEKSQRIAEVLLGSANPTELMAGKLLGSVAGSLTVFTVYTIGGSILATWQGKGDWIPWEILPWFVVLQVLGVFFFSSIFMAIGAAVSQLKEAQSLLMPVWMVLMSPMFVCFQVIRDPNGALAKGLSYFPPATPMTLTIRLASGAEIPLLDILLPILVLIAATALCVVAAGKIFRIGVLWQGKSPKVSDMFRWVFKNSAN